MHISKILQPKNLKCSFFNSVDIQYTAHTEVIFKLRSFLSVTRLPKQHRSLLPGFYIDFKAIKKHLESL